MEQNLDALQQEMQNNFDIGNKVEDLQENNRLSLKISTFEDKVRISIMPPNNTGNPLNLRVPHDIVCILDVSGSMASEAKVKNTEGVKESHGLSILGVLQHAVKTTIFNMGEQDRFSLVVFNSDARCIFPLTNMNESSKQNASTALESIRAEGSTNLAEGLDMGLNILKNGKALEEKNRHQVVMILTDGEPNINPPEGQIPHLQQFFKENPNFHPTINTFAFGKKMDSELLNHIAIIGHGQFLYIPCSSFMGTIFVNALSNSLSTMADNATLKLVALNGAQFDRMLGDVDSEFEHQQKLKKFGTQNKNVKNYGKAQKQPKQKQEQKVWKPTQKITINVGDLKFGQSRDFIIQMKQFNPTQPFLSVNLTYSDYTESEESEDMNQKENQKQQGKNQLQEIKVENYCQQLGTIDEDIMFDAQLCRLEILSAVTKAIQTHNSVDLKSAQQIVHNLGLFIKSYLDKAAQNNNANSENALGLKLLEGYFKDADGEIRLSFLKEEWFQQWGRHYLPSLLHAHKSQQCNNFADPGVQNYGGKLFQEIRDTTEQTFLKLPPPKTEFKIDVDQKQQQVSQNNNQNQAQQKPRSPSPVDMSSYYNSGGCFHPDCTVKMADGFAKPIRELRRNDLLFNPLTNSYVMIVCVVRIQNQQNVPFTLLELTGGLKVTPKHPVCIDGTWMKPCEMPSSQILSLSFADEVYNLILEDGHCCEVNGVATATFGHRFKSPNCQHPYFGSEKIINDLQKLPNFFTEGAISLYSHQFARNNITQQVEGLNC